MNEIMVYEIDSDLVGKGKKVGKKGKRGRGVELWCALAAGLCLQVPPKILSVSHILFP